MPSPPRPSPPYPRQVQSLGGMHLGLAQRQGLWRGIGYHRQRRRFLVYSYGGQLDKDGGGTEVAPHELVSGYADHLREADAEWLLAVPLSGGPGDAQRIIRAYAAEYGKLPPGAIPVAKPSTPIETAPPLSPDISLPLGRWTVGTVGRLLVWGWIGIVVLSLLFALLVVFGAFVEYFSGGSHSLAG